MTTGYTWDELYGCHDTGLVSDAGAGMAPVQHFAHPETKRRIHTLVATSGLPEHLVSIPARDATEADLLRVHTQRHIDDMREQSSRPGGGDAGDGDSPFGKGSFEIALRSAGGAIAMTEAVVTGQVAHGYTVNNPPGHHAEPDGGMGFCMFNNIAVAARYAQANLGVKRIAVVDWDVHHGNGTQAVFWDDPSVLNISLHQDRCYPTMSGGPEERGFGEGLGTSLNVPLLPGSGHEAYLYAFDQIIDPALREFAPDLIFVASGFDAGALDPLARCMATADTFAELTKRITAIAAVVCDGRVVLCQEGGYSPQYVPFLGRAVIAELAGVEQLDDPYTFITEGRANLLEDHQKLWIDAVALELAQPAVETSETFSAAAVIYA